MLISIYTWQWVVVAAITKVHIHEYQICRMVHEYNGMFSTYLIVHVNKILKQKFVLVNEKLKRSRFISCSQIRNIQSNYNELTSAIEDFSAIFGYQIMFVLGNATAVLVESVQNAVMFQNLNIPVKNLVIIWSVSVLVSVTVKVALNHYII